MISGRQFGMLAVGAWLGWAAPAPGALEGARISASATEEQPETESAAPDARPAAATSAPARQYAAAYHSLTQGDWLKDQGMLEEARALYTEAQALFQRLAGEYPAWETNVVAFRLNYCARELARLNSLPPDAMAALYRPPAPAAAAEATPAAPSPADEKRVKEHLRTALQKERGANLKRALEEYLAVLEEQPQNRDALKGAARCYLRAGLPDDARAMLQLGLSLPDPDAETNLLMAMLHCSDRDFYKAYQLLLVALNAQPGNAYAHLAMGVAQAGLSKLHEARVETQKAIQLDPRLGDAYYNLARISLKLKPSSPGVAREYYNNALRCGAAPDPALKKLRP